MNMTFRTVDLQLHPERDVSAKVYEKRRGSFAIVGASVLLRTG